MGERLLIRRFNLESVILDGSLNKFKEPQLVIKPELETTTRQSYNGAPSKDQPPSHRKVLMVHVKDKAHELEKLYLDTFSASSSPGATDPSSRHTVTCSRLECSLVFRYSKDARDNRYRTLMVRFRATADLEATMDELKLAGVKVVKMENASGENQGLTRMAVHPQLQHLVVVDQSALGVPVLSQQAYYNLSPSMTMTQGFTPPPGAFHHSGIMRPPSQPTPHFVTLQPGLPSWSPPPRPATTMGIPGILGEGVFKVSRIRPASATGVPGILGERTHKVSRIGSSSSNRSRGRKLASISDSPEQSGHAMSRHFNRRLERGDSSSRKRSFSQEFSDISQTDDRKAKLAKFLSNKYSNTSRSSTVTRGTFDDGLGARYLRPSETKQLEDSSSTITGMGATEFMTPHAPSNSESSVPTTGGLQLLDLEELANPSQSTTAMLSPLTRENRMIQQLNITQEGLTAATNVWNELMERGQIETEGDSLEEAQKKWARLGEEWVRRLQNTVSTTVDKLNKLR
ncbi:hypothetical protein QBC37DRAFT_74508 [Rhypophila decipiens]|uniref:Uncharacterized protein n=1 Tax=Rhypophila decipiens TaxID=261697 RepID=A0AAN7BDM7_9PEZI|nr:hypothetical protein QBC37DRAFT_74508 [Rhypophila decipiens]